MSRLWWKNNEIREDPRIKEIVDGGYADYEATLSVEELRQMHEHFKPYAASGVYADERWQQVIEPRLSELETVFIDRADEFSHFVVGLYDWSSGM